MEVADVADGNPRVASRLGSWILSTWAFLTVDEYWEKLARSSYNPMFGCRMVFDSFA